MKRYVALLAVVTAIAGAAVLAPAAQANSFAVSIGVPGLAIGYGNRGGYVAAYAPPPVYYGPAYYAPYLPAPVYRAPVAYGGVAFYGGRRPWPYRYRHW